MDDAGVQVGAVIGVAENGNSAVLVTLDAGHLCRDRRLLELTQGLPTHPYHHEGSWAVGRYLGSPWSRQLTLPEAVTLVQRVTEAAQAGARAGLASLAAAVPQPITDIAIRVCPALPETIEERITDTRVACMADSILYRQALAAAGRELGWRVHWYDRDQVVRDAAVALAGRDVESFLKDLGRALGPPWQARHKLAAAAALGALGAANDG